MTNRSLFVLSVFILAAAAATSSLFSPLIWLALLCGLILLHSCLDKKALRHAARWVRDPVGAPDYKVAHYDRLLQPLYKRLKKDRKLYQRIQEFNSEVESLARRLPAAIITIDEQYQLVWANYSAESFFGINPEVDKGMCLFNILRSAELADYIRHGEFAQPLYFQYRRHSTMRAFQLDVTRNSADHLLILCHDITQIEQMRRAQQDFVVNVSHELRSPLTIIIGFLETLRDMPPGSLTPEQRNKYYGIIDEQSHHMLALVTNLLTLSALESTVLQGAPELDISELAESALRDASALSNGQHRFGNRIEPQLHVCGSSNELLSAFRNILNNAVRYTPESGKITVSCRRDGENIFFSVKDTGVGIDARDIPRLTERFYRVEKSRCRDTGGTGLGLAITKHIIKRHKAHLSISSQLGKGSEFTIKFGPENAELLHEQTVSKSAPSRR